MTSNLSPTLPGIGSTIADLARTPAEQESGFSDKLQGAIEQVDSLHADAESQVQALLQGNGQELHGALIAVEKADLAFQLMMQVRNKVVNAYQEISRMQF